VTVAEALLRSPSVLELSRKREKVVEPRAKGWQLEVGGAGVVACHMEAGRTGLGSPAHCDSLRRHGHWKQRRQHIRMQTRTFEWTERHDLPRSGARRTTSELNSGKSLGCTRIVGAVIVVDVRRAELCIRG
jgi:hypothetical protein